MISIDLSMIIFSLNKLVLNLIYVVIWWKYLGILLKEFILNKGNILKYENLV